MAEIEDRPRWLLPGLLPGIGDDRLLVLPGHVPPPKGLTPVPRNVIHSAIRRWLGDDGARAVVMQLYRAVTAPALSEPQSWTSGEVESQLEPVLHTAFERRRLIAYLGWGARGALGGGASDAPPPSSKPPSSKPPSKPSQPPKPKPKPKITTVKIVSMTISSDHALMKENPAESWLNEGPLFPEPEWKPDKAVPFTHTMDETVSLKLELEVGPKDGTPESGVLVGKGPNGLAFESSSQTFKPGPMTLSLVSKNKLEKRIKKVAFAIDWSVTWDDPATTVSVTPSKTSNDLYQTMARPRIEDVEEDGSEASNSEDGVTLRRMKVSVEWAEAINSLDPHVNVEKLMAKVPGYTLITDKSIKKEYRHPDYMNIVGGAWPLTENPGKKAECQAIVRMVKAIVHQLGIPGDVQHWLVWADPFIDKGKTAQEAPELMGGLNDADHTRVRNGKVERAKLADSAVEVGKTYEKTQDNPGMNNYEACLLFEKRYYGGGVNKAGGFSSKDEVIKVFWGLVWIVIKPETPTTLESYTVTEIVATY